MEKTAKGKVRWTVYVPAIASLGAKLISRNPALPLTLTWLALLLLVP